MGLSKRTIARICRIFGYLDALKKQGIQYVSSRKLANAVGASEYSVRKDLSLAGIGGFTRRGYEIDTLKKQLGEKLSLHERHRACVVGLGRLGTALLDYKTFQEDGFAVVAGFDSSVNKIERIHTNIDVFPVSALEEVVRDRKIELGIITVPAPAAQGIAQRLCDAGVKGILNFAPVNLIVPAGIIYLDMDFTNALRRIAAQFGAGAREE